VANYRPVESLGDGQVQVVEDDDGFRLLLTPVPVIPARIWQQAYDLAVVLIVVGEHETISADDFIARRVEIPSQSSYEVVGTRHLDEPTYRNYLSADVAEEEIDPLANTEFVHLHTHTEYSSLDGMSTVREIMETIKKDPKGGGAIGSADHGNCACHPELQALADEYGVKPIFGMEAYFVPDRFRRTRSWYELDGVEVDPATLSKTDKAKAEKKTDSNEVRNEYTHLTLWAMDEIGLRNLWAMSTEAYRDGLFDGNARLDWDTLTRHAEGVICGTGCLRGPVSRPLTKCSCGHEEARHNAGACKDCICVSLSLSPDVETARENLLRLHAIFEDRLYIEVQTNQLPLQVHVNHHLEEFSRVYQIPPIAAVDSHYSVPEQKAIHQVWMAMQTGKTMDEESTLFQGNQDYHLKTADEVRASLIQHSLPEAFIDEAMANTVEIARRCSARVGGEVHTPTYSKESKEHPDPIQRDVERLIDVCLANWDRKITKRKTRYSQEVYAARFEREMKLLIDKGFCGYFLIVWDYVAWAKAQGCLVGPGRGSGGGSLVAYLADIVEIDPVESDLIFERFLTEGRKSLPDFDIDFPASWRLRIITYIKERWGTDYVANIGTITRLRTKAAINDTVRVLTPILPYEVVYKDFDVLKKAVEEADRPLAGKHLPWDEFQAQYADLVDPMMEAYPEIFAVVDVVMDRLKNYGKHAAGVVISTSTPLTDLPMFKTVDSKTKTEVMVTQFDMNALEILGYVKFDILTLRTLDTLQDCIDLIEKKYGRRINPYDWIDEYVDPQVWEEVSVGRTLGLFQIETASGTRLTKRMQPHNLFDLAAVMTVVRPGPMRSGLTESYLRRRAGLEAVTYPDPRLEEFLGDTYGSMIYQEQVMATCMNLAGYDSTEADGVRKLLGKKQVEKVVAAGEEFVRRAVECGTDQMVAETLWAQMAEFAKYGFNKAHAFGYAVIGHWCAFLRFHYPAEFLVAALSTVDTDRIPEFVEDCRRNGYEVRPPDVNRSKATFSSEGIEVLYGIGMVKGIGDESAKQIETLAPYKDLDDFIERCVKFAGSKVNMGHLKTLVEVGAFDSLVGNRKAVEAQLEAEASGAAKRCMFKVEFPVSEHPHNLPCGYSWANEPDPPMLVRGRGANKIHIPKEPPKACNIRCRQYSKPPPIDPNSLLPYNREEIMMRERELLGCWISHTPFDLIPPDVFDDPEIKTAQEIEAVLPSKDRSWIAIVLIEEVKKRKDRNGNDYAFVKMNIRDGEIEAICFSSVFSKFGDQIRKDTIGGAEIVKTPKGYQLVDYSAL
jgi:DNA polymerase III subunit alpha